MDDGASQHDRDLVQDFLQAFGAGDPRRLSAHLDRSVTWSVAGRVVLSGRGALDAFWSRLLPRYSSVQVELRRLMVDGGTRIADQVHVLRQEGGGSIVLENIAVYEVREGLITSWSDHFDLTLAPEDELKVWRRLRDVARAY